MQPIDFLLQTFLELGVALCPCCQASRDELSMHCRAWLPLDAHLAHPNRANKPTAIGTPVLCVECVRVKRKVGELLSTDFTSDVVKEVQHSLVGAAGDGRGVTH